MYHFIAPLKAGVQLQLVGKDSASVILGKNGSAPCGDVALVSLSLFPDSFSVIVCYISPKCLGH